MKSMKRSSLCVILVLLMLSACEKNRQPQACFEFPYEEGVTDVIIIPDNCSENASEYLWDDGNGNQYREFEPELIYSETGKYEISLTAFSANGDKQDVLTDSLQVNVPSGKVTFWATGSVIYDPPIRVKIGDQTETITAYYSNGPATCDVRGCANFTLPSGTHYFYAWSGTTSWGPWDIEISTGKCFKMKMGW